jgi:hypothetical protein
VPAKRGDQEISIKRHYLSPADGRLIAYLGATTHGGTFVFKRRVQEWFRGAVTAWGGESVHGVDLSEDG